MTPEEGYQEALRRIEKAKETGATELDLDGLGLISIPEALRSCDKLQSLGLHDNQISRIENLPDGLQSLNLYNN